MKLSVSEIQALNSPFVQFVSGDQNAKASRPTPPDLATAGALVYVSDGADLTMAVEKSAGIIVATKNALTTQVTLRAGQALFSTPSVSAAMAVLSPHFDTRKSRWSAGVSPLATLHPSAKLGKGICVGAHTVIGEDVVIGDNACIGPHCVIEKSAKIGSRSFLHSFVHIGADCEIGDDCEFNPHSVIGSEGFGFATDPTTGLNHKIPQLGKVVVENNVEFGSHCAVDRATLTETRIGAGCKFDNLIHIAHNCVIGKNGLFAAGFAIAGSCRIGDNFKCGGSVSVADHVTICDNVTVGGKSGITKDITQPGPYFGFPLQPWREGLRTLMSLPSVPELRREVGELRKQLTPK